MLESLARRCFFFFVPVWLSPDAGNEPNACSVEVRRCVCDRLLSNEEPRRLLEDIVRDKFGRRVDDASGRMLACCCFRLSACSLAFSAANIRLCDTWRESERGFAWTVLA